SSSGEPLSNRRGDSMSEPLPEPQPRAPKSRHGCATAWLVFMIIANAAVALMYLAMGGEIQRQVPHFPGSALPVLIVCVLLNIVFAVACLFWKKWGFYGFAVMSVVIFIINLLAGVGIQSATGLLGVVILYAVLQIGGEHSTWKQLE